MCVANRWGVCFETLWIHTNFVPGCGDTFLLHRCINRKILAMHALRRGFVLLFWNPAFPLAGPSMRAKVLLLGAVDESCTGLWQGSSEESLNLVLGLWWAGLGWWLHPTAACAGQYLTAVGLMAFNLYLSVLFPVCFFSASFVRGFKHMPRQRLSFLFFLIYISFVPMSCTIKSYPAVAVGNACHTIIVRIVSLAVE